MQVQAITRSVRISPRKVRLVADAVRKLSVDDAIAALTVMDKRAAHIIAKTLNSAIANATNNAKLDKHTLGIASIEVVEGQALKRYHPSTRGRIHPYKRRSSHIRVILEEKKVTPAPVVAAKEEKQPVSEPIEAVETTEKVGGKK
jgi:large subunit ribosomal protein L22